MTKGFTNAEGFTNVDWLDHLQKGSLPLDTAPFFFGGNLVTRESKKKNVVAQSSVKLKYKNNGTYCK